MTKLQSLLGKVSGAVLESTNESMGMKICFVLHGSEANIDKAINEMKRVLFPVRALDISFDSANSLLTVIPAVSVSTVESDVIQFCKVNDVEPKRTLDVNDYVADRKSLQALLAQNAGSQEIIKNLAKGAK